MIVVRTPLRLPIGGGGTDLPWYYSQHKGSFISAGIDKYITIVLKHRNFHDEVLVKYSKTEETTDINTIQNERVREALKLLGVTKSVEIVSFSDIPSNTGLGGSSTFTVALLHALHIYKKEYVSFQKLAEEACQVEINALKQPIGKQDQYAATFGGINHYTIFKNGSVITTPLTLSAQTIRELENNLFLFYTGIKRNASEVLQNQKDTAQKDPSRGIEGMHQIKEIGEEIRKALETGNTRRFGEWMNVHWDVKKKLSDKMTDPQIDKWYDHAIANSAVGGKIMGAGGGGFFMFYCDTNQKQFVDAMTKEGLQYMPFKFDWDGTRVLFNA